MARTETKTGDEGSFIGVTNGTRGISYAPKPEIIEVSVFREMATAPKDGSHVLLLNGETEIECFWHSTRHFVGGKGWAPEAWWKSSLTGERIAWEPQGWRPLNG